MTERQIIDACRQFPTTTPAFILDQSTIEASLHQLAKFREESGCKVLYSIKALPLSCVLEWVQSEVDGFSVSSLFEAQLASEVAPSKSLHLTTPGLRPDQTQQISRLCSHISFNSLSQLNHNTALSDIDCSLGLRLNPQLSFVTDDRYNPCRHASKLGVTLDDLLAQTDLPDFQGLHFHTNFGSSSVLPLLQTVDKIEQQIGFCFEKLKWLNFGGGYLPASYLTDQNLIDRINRLRSDWPINIYIEPGKGFLSHAGYLVTTVIDLFNRDGKQIVVLDTSVNHLPEVFEYQTSPVLLDHDPAGSYSYQLTGSTCLAGDVFGDFLLSYPLSLGDRLIFADVGAYSLVKAHRFNGYNLPDVYCYNGANNLQKLKTYSYQEYRQQWMVS